MSLFITRLKNWLGYENLTAQDVNAEFNNLVQKAGSDTLSSANSTNGTAPTVAAMQTQLNPGGLGSEVLALTTQQDIQQMRYVLAEITGNPYWYLSPVTSIAQLSANLNSVFTIPPSRIISARVSAASSSVGQPMFLVPGGSTNSVTLKATATNFIAYFNGVQVTFSADITLSGLTLAPGANNTCALNDANQTGQESSATLGEYAGTYVNGFIVPSININTVGANITALIGRYAAFKVGGEYFIAEVGAGATSLKNASRGAGFDNADAWVARSVMSNGATITLMNLAWIFATNNASTPALDVIYNKPTVSVVAPATPSVGDYWYDLINATWKKYSGASFLTVNAVYAGYTISDTTNVKVARSADLFKPYNQLNTVELEWVSATQVRTTKQSQQISVYGTTFPFYLTQPVWNVSTTLDTGVVLTANFTYYVYTTNTGDIKTSDIAPYERKYDLLGAYHPAKPWRCVGSFSTDAGSLITSASVSISLYHQSTLPLGSVAAGQLGIGSVISTGFAQSGTSNIANGSINRLQLNVADAIPAPTVQRFTATGTSNGYTFTVTAGNVTVGATYTNNANTFTALATVAAGTKMWFTGTGAPTGSGTLTRATGTGDTTITFASSVNSALYVTGLTVEGTLPVYLEIEMVGGGGGGASAAGNSGGVGTNTTFGATLLTGNGGGAGTSSVGGVGGATTVVGPTVLVSSSSQGSPASSAASTAGGLGGNSPFGGAGAGGNVGGNGTSASANSGSGGGGGYSGGVGSGGGGGSGGYIKCLIYNPQPVYAYAVGGGGTTGSGGGPGGSGASGIIIIKECYQ